jgi:protocatechuate 3,4-dioxygenase beta subunit
MKRTKKQVVQIHDEHDDDIPVGRILSRREALGLLGSAGVAALLTACGAATITNAPAQSSGSTTTSLPTATATSAATATTAASAATTASASTITTNTGASVAVVKPEMTEGPYFVDEKLNRSDIRANSTGGAAKEGLPLYLNFVVASVGASGTVALKDAQVDIWHCDAAGLYSDVSANNTVGQNFLRGYQLSDANGKASFTTIYPGWYSGRTVHIHFKIRTTGTNGQPYEFTSQLFFDEATNEAVYAQAPYSARGQRDMTNARDNIYNGGGNQMLLATTRSGDGYAATFAIGLDLSDTQVQAADGNSGGGGGGRPARP